MHSDVVVFIKNISPSCLKSAIRNAFGKPSPGQLKTFLQPCTTAFRTTSTSTLSVL